MHDLWYLLAENVVNYINYGCCTQAYKIIILKCYKYTKLFIIIIKQLFFSNLTKNHSIKLKSGRGQGKKVAIH